MKDFGHLRSVEMKALDMHQYKLNDESKDFGHLTCRITKKIMKAKISAT